MSETAFTSFIRNYTRNGERVYEDQLYSLGYGNPQPLVVDFYDLYAHNEELALQLIEKPAATLEGFEAEANRNRVRIRHLPVATPIREVDTAQLGRLIMIRGIVVKAGQETSKISKAAYTCTACGETIYVEQKHQFLEAPDKRCSCNSKGRWRINLEQTEYRDSQRLEVQESPDQLPPGHTPRRLPVTLADDLTGTVKPGDRVNVTGWAAVKLASPNSPKLELTRILLALHIEAVNRNQTADELTPEQTGEIQKLAKDPHLFSRITRSIAPSIYGHHAIKQAIALQQFGSDPVVKPDIRKRGDVHLLLVGDPGTSKSQMLFYATQLSHRGVYTSGRGSTAAGLTATAIRDKDAEGFSLEVGALVIADTGLCAIDEIEKMRDEDREAIHPAMEQQVVAINKGGINTTLNARCSVLAAANPKMGRYNPYQSVAENIAVLPVTLLTRFDLIFVIRDQPDEERDAATGDAILDLASSTGDLLTTDELRRYVSYAKRVHPQLTPAAAAHLKAFYLRIRKASTGPAESAAAVMITPRQLEALIRLTKAHARLHLRTEATEADTDAAIALFRASMSQVGVDPETGKVDIDMVELGKPRGMQERLFTVLRLVGELGKETGVAGEDEVKEALQERYGIGEGEAARLIGVLMRDGTIYSPRPRWLKRTN